MARMLLSLAVLAAPAGAFAAASAPVYWWRYNLTDAEKLDIGQMPCGASCSLAQLEAGCLAEPTCVAFNTDGWLKNSVSDMAPDTCTLYVKHSTPQPSPPTPAPVSFWPLPTSLSFGAGAVTVDPALAISVSPASALVSAYAARIADVIFTHSTGGPAPSGALSSLSIVIADADVPLTLGVDETYTLSIPANGSSAATLTARTIYGAYMGLQTFSQAVRFDYDSMTYGVRGAPLAIADGPKFAWRGILIDTDRHWLSLSHIMRIIDSLGYAKVCSYLTTGTINTAAS